ncbi:MAG: PepSY domain-containing protein [Dokdonella sp.]
MNNKNFRQTLIAIAAGTLLAGAGMVSAQAPAEPTVPPTNTTTVPSIALTEAEVGSKIAGAGFKEVKGLKVDNGVWKADARGGDEKWVAVFVHPLTGKVFQEGSPSKLTEEDIKAKVTAAGYQNIKDVEYKNGLWTADAETGKGNNVDLVIDPDDGSVINAAND